MLAVWLAPLIRAHETYPTVRLDGATLTMDTPAILDRAAGRTLVPVRFVAEPLGYKITWDGAERTVLAERNGRSMLLRIGEREALVNGLPVTLSVAPRLVKGRALVPLRFFAEFAGAGVQWDEASQTIDITSPTSRLDRPDAGWSLPQAGIRRTGFNVGATVGNRVAQVWQAPLKTDAPAAFFPATTGQGLVFLAGESQKLYALNQKSGQVAWESDLPATASPVYDAARGQIYVTAGGSESAKLYALDAATGAVRWFAAIGSRSGRQMQPLLVGARVIVNVSDEMNRGTLLAFDAATGSKLWQAAVQGTGVPAAYGARLFLADDFGGVYAYRVADGSPLWSRPGDGREREFGKYELLVDGGRAYVGIGRRVIALDEATGRLAWERTDMSMITGLASDGSKLWVTVRDGVNILDAANGSPMRYPAICNTWASSPVISRSHAFVTCDRTIYAIDRQSYQVTTLGHGEGPLSLDGDALYFVKDYSDPVMVALGAKK